MVDVIHDGAAALVRLEDAVPDVLITEIRVPLTDGATVARLGRSRSPKLQVVVLTRYPNQFLSNAFGDPEPVLLTKPLDYDRLLAELLVPRQLTWSGFA